MAKVVAGMTMSLDGFVHDSSGSSSALFRDLSDWRKQDRGQTSIQATGAVLMGRRTFEMASDPDSYADGYEYQVPIFVLTRHAPARHPKENAALTFTFVCNGLDHAVARAKAAAGERQVTVVGGATLIQSLLRAGLVDELEVDIIPVLLHDGLRLFEHVGKGDINLERMRVEAFPSGRTSLRFAVRT